MAALGILAALLITILKKQSPDTLLIGFKLLEGVSEDELFNVASNLLKKNNADYIVANLLDRIGNGKHFAMIINKNGVLTKCNAKPEIANVISNLIFK